MDESILRTIPLFESLPEDELAGVLALAHTHSYEPGELIFVEGDPSDCFVIVLEGQIDVVKALGTEDEHLLAVISEGEYVGEIGLFMNNQVRSASVRCRVAAQVMEIPRLAFQELLEQRPALGFHIMQEISQRLRNADDATIRDLRIKNKQLQQAYEELKAAQAQLLAKERMQTELATARKIQEGLLPRQMPQIAGWELAALWQPAREVSGDFYDFMSFPDGRLLIIIGDVTGKGVPAALVMATTRSVLRAAAQSAQQTGRLSPGSLLTQVNELLIPDMPPMMFVTCLVALLDPVSGKLAFANAGHCLPFQCNRRSTVELLATGMPLGLMPGMLYDEQSSVIEPGDRLFMFSDGLVEAHNPKGEMFGKDRILQKLNSSASDKNGKGEMLIASLQDALKQFSGAEWEQEDDVTFVVLTRA